MSRSNKILTVIELFMEKIKLQDELTRLQSAIGAHPFHSEIRAVLDSGDYFTREAEQLAKMVQDRDYPMTRSQIEDAFKTSGFVYTQDDINLAKPDQDQVFQNWIDEERRNQY